MEFDALHYPNPSQRMAFYARRGMVATSQPLAAQAGLSMLARGGNAVDAAIAAAICLTVTEPSSNGIGGDVFALVWMKDKLYGLNGSGPAPMLLTPEEVKRAGYDEMPTKGWLPVTVPGAPASWAALSERFGKLDFAELFQPAVEHAANGVPIAPGNKWDGAYNVYKESLKEDMFSHWFTTFAPNGYGPRIGELWRSPDHADTLTKIAATRADAFYRGELADKIDAFSRTTGGYLRLADLAAYSPEWVEPIRCAYRGYDIWQIPPNGQGLVVLSALQLLNGFEPGDKDDAGMVHRQIEAMKLAFADGMHYITDRKHMPVSPEQLLSSDYIDRRRALIGETALWPDIGKPYPGGTVYAAAADGEGNMVSLIQSNYLGFGSGLVVPGTGISLQDRGHTFSLDPRHPNYLQPGKKTYHTIIPGFMTKGSEAVGPLGVVGGYMQPQGQVQVISNMIDFHLNPQAALDAPRWQWKEGKTVLLERGFPAHIADRLQRMGHEVLRHPDHSGFFGYGQVIIRDAATGILIGGADPRTSSIPALW